VSLTELAGRKIVITGASRGIGFGIAQAFAAAGARLHLLADDPAVEAAAQSLGATGGMLDITDEAAVTREMGRLGAIDVLINNAGLERMTPLDDAGAENTATFKRIAEINITGTFLVTRAALPSLCAGGRIINTASVWGRVAEPLFGAYVASKHAVIGLTKTWARELGPRGITVNAVCPGWVKTQASLRSLNVMAARSGQPESELLDDILSSQALPGLMEPQDVAGPYLFLASSLAANVTGQTLGVDRGEVPW
jgi:NAD(P)-dependent dehydrogenase (short-subunit alcohol dehydrogenase family)